ncbi:MAG: septum formation protein Maf [Planctomycetes bacterium RBG_16_64_10]|nr:MAG: septum formation protein Maf [Planctomycetes bacterium RBG_16_64_10]
MAGPEFILASASPRRRDLLLEAGYQFQVVQPEPVAECGLCTDQGPAALVAELAYRKAANVRQRVTSGTVLACDTVAECQGQILGKPRDRAHARAMLTMLSGREHRVYSGLCVWRANSALGLDQVARNPDVRVAVTSLRMDTLSEAQLTEYLDSRAWEGKAGAFGYQDRLGWVHLLEGSPSNVVGLPLELLAEMLHGTA